MTEISKAFLIKEFNFQDNDKILHFILDNNEKLVTFAPGVRKITSKNARNIFIGHLSEIEYFYSPEKMSKLKKINLLQDINMNNWSISYICDYIFKKQDTHTINFFIFLKYLVKLKDKEIIIISLLCIIWDSGTSFYLSGCISCKKKKNIVEFSFKRQGLICFSCNKYNIIVFNKKESMFLYELFSYKEGFNYKDILNNIFVDKKKNLEILYFFKEQFKNYFFNTQELIDVFLDHNP